MTKSELILKELIEDVEAVGDGLVQEDWPDLVTTYLKAVNYFKEPVDPTTESLLHEVCIALGWQGGTRVQVIEEIERLKRSVK